MKYTINNSNLGIKALPINFKGKFLGFAFSILNQFDIYGQVEAEFYSNVDDKILFSLKGNKQSVENGIKILCANVIGNLDFILDERGIKNLQRDITKFLKQVNLEVENYNSKKMIPTAKKFTEKKQETGKIIPAMAHRKKTAIKKTAIKKTAKKKLYKQAGSSNIIYDKRFQALPPGKRKARDSGNVYYESRANRSDKGRLLGIGDIPLHQIGTELFVLESTINTLKAEKKHLRTIGERKMKQEKISLLQKQFKSLREYLNTRARFK